MEDDQTYVIFYNIEWNETSFFLPLRFVKDLVIQDKDREMDFFPVLQIKCVFALQLGLSSACSTELQMNLN